GRGTADRARPRPRRFGLVRPAGRVPADRARRRAVAPGLPTARFAPRHPASNVDRPGPVDPRPVQAICGGLPAYFAIPPAPLARSTFWPLVARSLPTPAPRRAHPATAVPDRN